MKPRLHVLLVTNQDWFFLSYCLPLARAAKAMGAKVTVVAADSGKGEIITNEGFRFVRMPISRQSVSPLSEVRTLAFLFQLYRHLQPDLVHQLTVKPVVYGSLASHRAPGTAVINTIPGLGYTFTSRGMVARAIRPLVKGLYRAVLKRPRSRTIFENPDDLGDFVRMRLVPSEQAVLIRSCGVDCSLFRPTSPPPGAPIVMLAARMLWDKGVAEFVKAARLARQRGLTARFVLVGAPDFGNPNVIPVRQLEAWSEEGVVEWWGHREHMPEVLSMAAIVVLPTAYGEGLPRILVEAAASGRPIVATNVRGCREIVRPNVNGLLVAPHDPVELCDAIRTLLACPGVRERFGQAGRAIAVAEFSQERVVSQTLGVYEQALSEQWPS